MIYYWNKPYFEGLKAIGEAMILQNGFELFGEYCLNKELGLKKAANRAALEFVKTVQNKPDKDQRKIILFLCELNYSHPKVHSLLNHPIEKLIQSVLSVWVQNDPNSIDAYRWYARYCSWDLRDVVLSKALELAPTDSVILDQSLNILVNNLDYMVHHLNENFLIGERADADVYLSKLEQGISVLKKGKFKTYIQSEHNYHKELFELWDKYVAVDRTVGFIDWAKNENGFDL